MAFVAGSLCAHGLLVAALVAPWPAPRDVPAPQAAPGSVEVVMVQQPAMPPARPPQPTPQPTSQPAPRPTPRPTPAAAAPAPPAPPLPTPPDSAAAPPPMAAAAPPPPPAVNLGEDPSELWNVHSDTVQPPAPDARYQNLPPRYPAEAAARGEGGTVGLLIHVAADGSAAGADIVESSGFAALDGEARRAVLLWHFAPARQDGAPVPFDYLFSIHFRR